MIDDIRNKCVEYNVKIHCECYDGQFLQLVRYSEEGKPLTRLTVMQEFFKSMPLKNRKDCLKFIMDDVIPNKLELDWNIDGEKLKPWSTYCSEQKKSKGRRRSATRDILHSGDVTNLLRGSQLGRDWQVNPLCNHMRVVMMKMTVRMTSFTMIVTVNMKVTTFQVTTNQMMTWKWNCKI